MSHGHNPVAFAATKAKKKALKDKGWAALKASEKDEILRELATK
jgi:hypothetical protein